MSDIIIPDELLETFRCSLCNQYLSSAPVQVLSDGNSICSICSRSTEQQTYRELKFEALLSKLSFPCRFKKNGCEKNFPFSEANEHEENCLHRSFICPMANKDCSWEGLGTEMYPHFTTHHSDLTKDQAEFKLQLNKDQYGMFVFVFQDVPFVSKFTYHSDTCSLQYDVRYFINNIEKACCGIRLTNDSDSNSSVSLKEDVCMAYNMNFYDVQYSKILVLANYTQVLENPECIKVGINPSVTKSQAVTQELVVNNDLLQKLRCKRCRGYLIPPIYDSCNGIICIYCHEKFSDSRTLQNIKLKETVAAAVFPCCWPKCAYIGKAGDIKQHQSSCLRRVFKCLNCKISFTRNRAKSHLKYHGYKYFTDTIVYKMSFQKHFRNKNLFTFVDNEIVVIKKETISACTRYDRHVMSMHVIGSYCSHLNVQIEFAHKHCQIKSKKFILNNYEPCYCFMLSDLPLCFKPGERLRVTLSILGSNKL